MKILIVGDSLTGNYSIAPKKSWTELLSEDIKSIKTITMNGATSSEIFERTIEELNTNNYENVAFLMGTNDAFCGRDENFIYENIEAMKRLILNKNAKAIVIVPPGIKPNLMDEPIIAQRAETTLKELQGLIWKKKTNESIIDLRDAVYEFPKDKNLIFTDGLHFTYEFHEYLKERLEPFFKALTD